MLKPDLRVALNVGFLCVPSHIFARSVAQAKIIKRLKLTSSQGPESNLELEELEERRREGELLPGGEGGRPTWKGDT